MQQLNINEVKTHRSGIPAQVKKGESVIICKRNKPITELKPIQKLKREKRPLGLLKKNIPISRYLTVSTTHFQTTFRHISQVKRNEHSHNGRGHQSYPIKTLW